MCFLLHPIAIIALGVVVLIILFHRHANYWSRKNIPQLENHFPWGHVPSLIMRNHPLSQDVRDYYTIMKGRSYRFAGFNIAIVQHLLVIDPELIKDIMVRKFEHFVDRSFYYNEKDDPLSANLMTLEGERWHKVRERLTPTFTSSKLKLLLEFIVESGKLLEDKINQLHDKKENLDVKELASRFTTDIIGRCAFGIECNSMENPDSEFRKYFKKMMSPAIVRSAVPLFGQGFPNLARKLGLRTTPKDVSDFFTGTVKSAIDYRCENNVKRMDFLQLLIEMMHDNEKPLTHKEVAANSFFIFLTGFETSSATLKFSLYELAIHQDIQNKARREINKVLVKYEGVITYEALNEMKYLEQIIDETLRKYPPIPLLTRCCTKDYVIPGTKILLEKSTKIMIPIYALHHDPQFFPEPQIFNPDRFSSENKPKIIPSTYIPFGEGPRNCIGIKFSYLETKVGLISFLKNFRFSLNSKTPDKLTLLPTIIILINREVIYLDIEKYGDI